MGDTGDKNINLCGNHDSVIIQSKSDFLSAFCFCSMAVFISLVEA